MKKAIDPNDMTLFCGLGEQFYSYEAIFGCAGFVTSGANFMPDWSYSIYQIAEARDFAKVDQLLNNMALYREFFDRITTKRPHIGIGNNAAPMYLSIVKHAMDMVGLRGGEVRLPITGLTTEEKVELEIVLKKLNIIS
jgi:dihydrodipicolinate synthase/N-acetylneuraminate lyase